MVWIRRLKTQKKRSWIFIHLTAEISNYLTPEGVNAHYLFLWWMGVFFDVSIQLGMLPSENIVMPIFKKREKYLGTYEPIKLPLTVCKTSEQS